MGQTGILPRLKSSHVRAPAPSSHHPARRRNSRLRQGSPLGRLPRHLKIPPEPRSSYTTTGELWRTTRHIDPVAAIRHLSANSSDALAYLVRSLHENPRNDAAVCRLATCLIQHSWNLPALVLRHRAKVTSAEFSPDGKKILTASLDGTARVWNAQTGAPLTPLLEHKAGVRLARFDPSAKKIITVAGELSEVSSLQERVWDAETNRRSGIRWR